MGMSMSGGIGAAPAARVTCPPAVQPARRGVSFASTAARGKHRARTSIDPGRESNAMAGWWRWLRAGSRDRSRCFPQVDGDRRVRGGEIERHATAGAGALSDSQRRWCCGSWRPVGAWIAGGGGQAGGGKQPGQPRGLPTPVRVRGVEVAFIADRATESWQAGSGCPSRAVSGIPGASSRHTPSS